VRRLSSALIECDARELLTTDATNDEVYDLVAYIAVRHIGNPVLPAQVPVDYAEDIECQNTHVASLDFACFMQSRELFHVDFENFLLGPLVNPFAPGRETSFIDDDDLNFPAELGGFLKRESVSGYGNLSAVRRQRLLHVARSPANP
jgi:hypothetical protein